MPANFQDLVALMARLRSPDGCPWDREQTYATLAPMLVEEAYEAFEAVEEARAGRPANLCEELGDLLFQIVFYAQVASERGDFTADDVTGQIHAKMVRRHPHVFGDVVVRDNEELLRNWEALKAEEKRAAGKGVGEDISLLDGVSSKAPALMEAHQLATKAARVGFDWQNVEQIFDKLHEEINELKAAIKEKKETEIEEEIGDLLFVIVNLARHLDRDAETALKLTNRKFRRRFSFIENELKKRGKTLTEAKLEEMDGLWNEAKKVFAEKS